MCGKRLWIRGVLALGLGFVWSACGESAPPPPGQVPNGSLPTAPSPSDPGAPLLGPDGLPITGATLGESCGESEPCRMGLACDDGSCALAGGGASGDLCVLSGECGAGLTCGPVLDGPQPGMRCVPAGEVDAGGACGGPAECAPGLRCAPLGLAGVCEAAGEGDIGASCQAASECAAPLVCVEGRTRCELPIFGLPGFPELDCPGADIEAFRVHFEVRDAPREDGDFFRLPFPTDMHLTESGIDLRGFPQRGVAAAAEELLGTAIQTLENSGPDGFSLNPTITFRLSRAFDLDSFRSDDEDAPPVITIVDITPGSPDYGRNMNRAWRLNTGRTPFVCRFYATVRPVWTRPLRPGTTYAAWITTDVRDESGNGVTQDADFAAMLSSSRPDGEALRRAWDAYAPLRAYLAASDEDGDGLAAAAVFTTMSANPVPAALHSAVEAGTRAEWLEAGACGEDGPCGRACAGGGDFEEIHARIRLPIWQRGERPHLTPAEGGDVRVGNDGVAQANGAEETCAVLTIPEGEAPEGGYPVVLVAHGTGGDAASHLRDGTAGRLASVELDGILGEDGEAGEATVRMATLGFDGVAHGDRRGGSDLSPDVLFFNALNPLAGRGNVEQGAGDLFALLALLREGELATGADSSVGLDADAILFLGHSQGATVGAPFLAHADGLAGAVLSGAAGGFALSLLTKTEPVNLAAATRFVLRDTAHQEHHPVLHLLQTLVDPVDSLNFARDLLRERSENLSPLPLFMTFGLEDKYTPVETQEAFATAANFPHVVPGAASLGSLAEVDAPAADNVRVGEVRVTAGVRSYAPQGYDGHFVAFRHPQATADVARFLAGAALGQPRIGE